MPASSKPLHRVMASSRVAASPLVPIRNCASYARDVGALSPVRSGAHFFLWARTVMGARTRKTSRKRLTGCEQSFRIVERFGSNHISICGKLRTCTRPAVESGSASLRKSGPGRIELDSEQFGSIGGDFDHKKQVNRRHMSTLRLLASASSDPSSENRRSHHRPHVSARAHSHNTPARHLCA